MQYIHSRSLSSGLIICLLLCSRLKSFTMVGFIRYANIEDSNIEKSLESTCSIRPGYVRPISRGVTKANLIELTSSASHIQTRISSRLDTKRIA